MKKLMAMLLSLLCAVALCACENPARSYTVSFETNGGSAIESLSYTEGDKLTVADPERDGWHFAGWYTDESLSAAWDGKTISDDTTLYAAWGENKNGIFQVAGEMYWFDEDGGKIKGEYSFYPAGDTESETIYYFNVTGGEGLKYSYHHVTGNLWYIQDPAECVCWLIRGEKKALMVDTGAGVGSTGKLLELILGDFPYEVALTHYHHDHSGGTYSLPMGTPIYLGKEDIYGLDCRSGEGLDSVERRYSYFTTENPKNHTPCSYDDFSPGRRLENLIGVQTGDSVDIGGNSVQFFTIHSHSQGSLGILFTNERLLVIGDGLNSNTQNMFEDSAPVETFLASLRELKGYEDRWDGILPSHITTSVQNKDMLDRTIEVCEAIVAKGSWEGEKEGPRGGWVCSNGHGGLTYRKDNIFEEQHGYLKVPEDYER